jgi:hypothetical protein
MKTFKIFEKWFELNLGWFFVNGRKQESWFKHLKEKYPNEKTQS